MRNGLGKEGHFRRTPCIGRASLLAGAAFLALNAMSARAFAQCSPTGPYGSDADIVTCAPGAGETIDTVGGNDEVSVSSGSVADINQGDGADTFTLSGGTVGSVTQGNQNDTATISGGTVTGAVHQGQGRDHFEMSGGTIGSLDQSGDRDTFVMTGGHILGTFANGDLATFSGGRIGAIDLEAGNNELYMSGAAIVDGNINAENGSDLIVISGGSVGGLINTGSADDTIRLSGGSVGGDVLMENGNDRFEMSGGSVGGHLLMGAGDDAAIVTGVEQADLPVVLDGGLDMDSLTFEGVAYTGGSAVLNWENLVLDQGSVFTLDSPLVMGDGGSGDGTVDIRGASALVARGGAWSVVGNVANSGTIALDDGTAGDSLTIEAGPGGGGNYVGSGGTLALDAFLDDGTGAADRLIIGDGGSATGTTQIIVNTIGGPGGVTQPGVNGIELVTTEGTATSDPSAFVLGRPVIAGVHQYELVQGGVGADTGDQDWYLRSAGVGPTPEVYGQWPGGLIDFGRDVIGTMQQRVGDRYRRDAADRTWLDGRDGWLRVAGRHGTYAPQARPESEQAVVLGQGGLDGLLYESAGGDRLIAGVMAHVGHMKVDLASYGSIASLGVGGGVSLTWLGAQGGYVDAVTQGTWYDNSFSLEANGAANGIDDFMSQDAAGWSASLETGKRFALDGGWGLVPQAQIVWSETFVDDFTDAFGAAVSLSGGESLRGRLGLRVEKITAGERPSQFYGIVNLHYEFLDPPEIVVEGIAVSYDVGEVWGEVGLGGTLHLNETASLYGEVSYATPLDDEMGDSRELRGVGGVKLRW